MTATQGLQVDLRKADPLGLDFTAAYDRAHSAAQQYVRLGEPAAPGFDHARRREECLYKVQDFVIMARVIIQALGEERACKIKGLQWAMQFQSGMQVLDEWTAQANAA